MKAPVVSNVLPQDIRAVGGFLGQRFDADRAGRLKDALLSEQFIRLHERKNYDDWFWMGEQVGKWLDASAYAALIADDQALLARVEEIVSRLAASQEDDGYLGITSRFHRTPARGMELYEMYYVLHGLLVCYDLLGNEQALLTAQRLGDYIMALWGVEAGQFPLVGPFPGNGHDGGEGTLILEPIARLGQRTGDPRYVDWCERTLACWDDWWAAYPQANHSCGYTAMQQFAAGERDVFDLRENMHAHTFHMTLLGIAALYNAMGKEEYRDVVLGSVDRLADEWIFLTGGMSSLERYVPHKYYNARNQIEVCPQHTWILLLDQALKWTGEARYAAEIERDLFNHFLAAQLADGSNWSYFTPLNGRAREPEGPNCCNAAGHRIAGRMPTYLAGLRSDEPALFLYSDSEVVLRPPGQPTITLRQQTDFPTSGKITIHVDPAQPANFRLHLRIPEYAAGATAHVVSQSGGHSDVAAQAGQFMSIERRWSPGDIVQLDLPMTIRCQADDDVIALMRGPLTYAYFQDAQPETLVFHHRRGLYPEDLSLCIDPEQVVRDIVEEAAPDGMVGPLLRMPGTMRGRGPLFASSEANAALPGKQKQTIWLHPFVNQGAIRGEYSLFMDYEKA